MAQIYPRSIIRDGYVKVAMTIGGVYFYAGMESTNERIGVYVHMHLNVLEPDNSPLVI